MCGQNSQAVRRLTVWANFFYVRTKIAGGKASYGSEGGQSSASAEIPYSKPRPVDFSPYDQKVGKSEGCSVCCVSL